MSDAAIALAALVPSLLALPAGGPDLLRLRLGAVLLAAATMLLRRRAPWLVLVAASVAALLDQSSRLFVMAASYAVAVHQRRHRAAVLALPVLLGALYAVDVSVGARAVTDGLVALIADVLLPAGIGAVVRRHRRYGEALRRGDQIVDGLASGAAELAVERERARLARELHDSLGHHLSIVALYAGVLEQRADGDRKLSGPARTVQDACVAAAQQLSSIVGVLNGHTPHTEHTDPCETVGELVSSLRAAGADIELRVPGDGEGIRFAHSRALTVFRIAQEALTNTLKHAPGARTVVTLTADRDRRELTLTVRNGPPRGPGWAAPSSGYGLRGMRERAESCGGELRAGPLRDGGFEVHAVLPWENEEGGAAAARGAREGEGEEPLPCPTS